LIQSCEFFKKQELGMKIFSFETIANEMSSLFLLIGMVENKAYKVSEIRDNGLPILDAALASSGSKPLDWGSMPQISYRKLKELEHFGYVVEDVSDGPLKYKLNQKRKDEILKKIKCLKNFCETITEALP
jgi:hypothetical protein